MFFDSTPLSQTNFNRYENYFDRNIKRNNYDNIPLSIYAEPYMDGDESFVGDVIDITSAKKETFDPAKQSDGEIGDFSQGNRGDCYFLSALKALSLTDNGKKTIKNSIKDNGDGSYTVVLPGALKVKEKMEKNGVDCPITGEYKISAELLNQAMNTDLYASGDIDVVILELAMEEYLAQVDVITKDLDMETADIFVSGVRNVDGDDTLSGGLCNDAMFVLTGKKSDIYTVFMDEEVIAEEEGGLSRLVSADDDIDVYAGESIRKNKSIISTNYNHRAENAEELRQFLEECTGESRYAMTASFKVDDDGNILDRNSDGEGHALSVKRVTKDSVELINPWDTSKTVVISKEDFVKKVRTFTRTDMENQFSGKSDKLAA